MIWNLWRWSRKEERWVLESKIAHEDPEMLTRLKRTALRNFKRRNPSTTICKWRMDVDGPPQKRPFRRKLSD